MIQNFLITLIMLFILNSCASKLKTETIEVDMTPIILTNIDQALLLELINKARSQGRKCGDEYNEAVEPLVWNELLERLAYNHSHDMVENNFFDHTGSDGRTLGDRLDSTGYSWGISAENIGLGYSDEKTLIAEWLNSHDHCQNIMNGVFTEVGVAKDGEYWTQVFID